MPGSTALVYFEMQFDFGVAMHYTVVHMKTEVYSWRISSQTKCRLEDEARRRGTSMANVLEEITAQWFSDHRNGHEKDDAQQVALRRRVMATVGGIHSGDTNRAGRSRELVREIVARKHGKEARAAARRIHGAR
jgi:hypothetical protein